MSYKSNSVSVPEGIVPAYAEACPKLYNSLFKPESERYDPLRYNCDICGTFFAPSKFLVVTHKSVEHKITIPPNYKG